jgi:hypothetical protein
MTVILPLSSCIAAFSLIPFCAIRASPVRHQGISGLRRTGM